MKLILDLCGGSGAWSAPYRQAGYAVAIIDPLQDGEDVRLLSHVQGVHGILAAPPCTYFCRMRMCRGRPTDAEFLEGLSVVDACLRIILLSKPKWWALENPQGYLHNWLGPPQLKFDPWEYGDPWTKRTWIWGDFQLPRRTPVQHAGPYIHRKPGQRGFAQSDSENAVTPAGFTRAFFEANP